MKLKSLFIGLAALAALAIGPALAQTLVLSQVPAPAPSASSAGNSQLYTQYQSVAGGALYQTVLVPKGGNPSVASTFVAGGAGSQARYLNLTEGKLTTGLPMTGVTGSSTSFGVARTAGTSLTLVGTATSSSATTNKVFFEFNLPSTYVAGANIPVVVNANYTGGGTVTAASTTVAAQLYTETAGVEAAVTTSASQQFTGTAAAYTFTVTGTGLVPGQHVSVELTMVSTTSAGAITGQVNSVAYTA